MTLILRLATIDDSRRLFEWRNDLETRRNSRTQGPLDPIKHEEWLRASLTNPARKIYIAEENGVPVGTVRLDDTGDFVEVSWTVAPEARGRGLGKEIVLLFRSTVVPTAKIQAAVRKGNVASEKIAAALGLSPSAATSESGDLSMIIWK